MAAATEFFGIFELLWHRGLCWFFRTPLLKEVLRFVLAKIGYQEVYNVFAMRAHKFHVRYAV